MVEIVQVFGFGIQCSGKIKFEGIPLFDGTGEESGGLGRKFWNVEIGRAGEWCLKDRWAIGK